MLIPLPLPRLALGALLPLLSLLSPTAAAKGPVELTISCGRFAAEAALCREAAEDWAEDTGNRVRVLAATQPSRQRIALYEELLGVGTARLDVLEIDVIWPARLAEHLLDLRPHLHGDEQDFLPELIANNTVDGRLVALPWFLDLGLLYYRRDLLDAAAIPIPRTWPALEDAAMRLQDGRRGAGDNRFWGFLWQGSSGEALTCNVVEWIASWNGGGIVERSGHVSVDNPSAAYALERAARWIRLISPPSVLADAEAETLERFTAGDAAFMRHWPYAWETLQAPGSPLRGKVGVTLLPRGGVEGRHAAALGGWQLAVSKYSRHPEQAAELVRHLTSARVQRARALAHGYLPTRTELLSEPAVLATAPYVRFLASDSDVLFAVRPSSVTGPWYPEVSQRLQGAALQVLMAGIDAEIAVGALASALDLLSQNGSNWSARHGSRDVKINADEVTDDAESNAQR